MSAGLYLHVPYCSVVCPYCDFAVRTGGAERRHRFASRLLDEARLAGREPFPGTPFHTVSLGGGTPSSLAPDDLARVLSGVREQLDVGGDARVSMEVNPEDVSAEAVAAWRAAGVGTLSLGVQSFDAAGLRLLGRRHSPGSAAEAVRLARGAGFETVSLDLIFGLPGQDAAAWRRELEAAAELAPDHVSCYQLTFHEGTPFWARREQGRLREPPGELQAELFELAHERLGELGYEAYEVSNFARGPEHRSAHNAKYWRHEPYLGLGPSAHSFDGRSRRWWNLREVDPWEAELSAGRRPIAGQETLSPSQLALEAVALGLRTTAGVDLDRVGARTGLDLESANATLLDRLAARGLLVREGSRLRPTRRGLALADALAAEIEVPAASGELAG